MCHFFLSHHYFVTAFSGVGDLTVVTAGDDALHITWTAPSRPHGFITRYSIVVENNDTEVRPGHRTESITTFTSHSTSGLGKQTDDNYSADFAFLFSHATQCLVFLTTSL